MSDEPADVPRAPVMRATYRLQLTPDFGFAAARELVPYLAELGVSHLYLSPIMRAVSGSTHGYDVVDPTQVSPELGGEEALRELVQEARHHELGVVVDFVPNHMANHEDNPFWSDPERRRVFFDADERTGWQRRFFTIDDLAGVRVEDPEVFAETHAKILQLVREGLVDGLRIDHPDGLADPAEYLRRLRESGVEHIWVEKILEAGEQLRDWPVQGTTGYEFANDVTALFVDPHGEATLTELYKRFTGLSEDYERVVAAAKLEQAQTAFVPELGKLRSLWDVPDLEQAVASLHVYRSYVRPAAGEVTDEDRELLASLPEPLRRVLLLEDRGHDEFVVRFQQTTGPIMAKGVEDTAFYRYLRLTALNEVGGNPGRFSLPASEFHAGNRARAQRFPLHLLASQTHDTKRSGDVRARIGALAGRSQEWAEHVTLWHTLTEPLRHGPGPDGNEEYLIYQTLVGAWPIAPERLTAYLEKALREAKVNTSWESPNEDWEESVKAFARGLYTHAPFLESFDPFVASVAVDGRAASIGALVLRLTCPGVGDIYQGDELIDLSLVDPDNRRPVDWDVPIHSLQTLRDGTVTEDAAKQHVIRTTLALRERLPEPFIGSYEPLQASDDVCAFTRGSDVAVIVGLRPEADVDSVALPEGNWRELLADVRSWAPVRLAEATTDAGRT
jgi:(1->4)-alpha-D-glucan 1-alpha-D-glucosylmutase